MSLGNSQRVVNEGSAPTRSRPEWLPERGHTFSHYHLRMRPVLLRNAVPQIVAEGVQRWCKLGDLPALGLPAPIKQLLGELAAANK